MIAQRPHSPIRQKTTYKNPNVKPFLKWAGGKRWLVQNYSHLFPRRFNRYIEPFLGSGAVFFHLKPEKSILGDTNSELVNTYSAIKTNWRLVYRYLREHHTKHSTDYYYQIRARDFKSPYSRAAKFIYLNRTCWNGLYRVNLKGIFNVPIGTKSSVIFDDDRFDLVSEKLQHAEIISADFEKIIDSSKEGDLVFVDPPYTVSSNNGSFVKYNEKIFSWFDQIRLFHALKRAKSRGVNIIGTNAYHHSIQELYENDFKLICASRKSTISSKASTRNNFEEFIILTEDGNG